MLYQVHSKEFCSYASSIRGLDAFCTAFLHFCLFSTSLSSSFLASTVQLLVLSIHLIFRLPLALPPGMFLCIIPFSRLSSFFLIILCPKYVSFLFLIDSSSCLSVFALCSTHSFVLFSVHDIRSTCPRHFISNAFISSCFLMVHLSHLYVATGNTKSLSSFTCAVFAIP